MQDDNKIVKKEADSSSNEESASFLNDVKNLEKMEEFIDAIPAEQQKEEARSILREISRDFTQIIERPSQTDPETVKIISDNLDKDNERRFQFLTQKERNNAELEQSELEFRKEKHANSFSLIRPIVVFVLLIVTACLVVGIWLCVIGKETLGASLITGSLSGVLSFAAGFGMSGQFKEEKKK